MSSVSQFYLQLLSADFPGFAAVCCDFSSAAAFFLFLLFFHVNLYAHHFKTVFLRAFLIHYFNLIQFGLKLDELFKIRVQLAFVYYFNLVKIGVTRK